MLTKQVISLPAMEALTVTTFQGIMLLYLNADFFVLLPLGFGKKCKNKFWLDTHKISFALFMLQHCGCP